MGRISFRKFSKTWNVVKVFEKAVFFQMKLGIIGGRFEMEKNQQVGYVGWVFYKHIQK